MNKSTLLIELQSSLEAARNCSETIEYLLIEAKLLADTTPEMHKKIITPASDFQAAIHRYENAYQEYSNLESVR